MPEIGVENGHSGSFDGLDDYVPDRRYRGFERMTLNNSRQDRSYLNQCLSYAAFNAAGVESRYSGEAVKTVESM